MRRLVGVLVIAFAAAALLLVATGGDLAGLQHRLLIHAAMRGDVAILRGLLVLGADTAATSSGGSAIHAAAWAGHRDAVEVLLAHGADVDVIDSSGTTPLMAAAAQGHDEVVRLLVTRGASLTATSRCGNALDIALANRRETTATILRAAGVVASGRPR